MPRLFLSLLLPLLIAPSTSAATIINFDTDAAGNPLAAPQLFVNTTHLTTLYSSLGVTFQGPGGNNGGAILDQDSNFGVPAFSGRNFLAFNRDPTAIMMDGGFPVDPETIFFSLPMATVSIQAAGGDRVISFMMQAFNGSNTLIGTASYSGQFFGSLSISAPGITRVVLTETSGGPIFVYDNLVFDSVPEPTTGLLVIAGLLGFGVRRRVSA